MTNPVAHTGDPFASEEQDRRLRAGPAAAAFATGVAPCPYVMTSHAEDFQNPQNFQNSQSIAALSYPEHSRPSFDSGVSGISNEGMVVGGSKPVGGMPYTGAMAPAQPGFEEPSYTPYDFPLQQDLLPFVPLVPGGLNLGLPGVGFDTAHPSNETASLFEDEARRFLDMNYQEPPGLTISTEDALQQAQLYEPTMHTPVSAVSNSSVHGFVDTPGVGSGNFVAPMRIPTPIFSGPIGVDYSFGPLMSSPNLAAAEYTSAAMARTPSNAQRSPMPSSSQGSLYSMYTNEAAMSYSLGHTPRSDNGAWADATTPMSSGSDSIVPRKHQPLSQHQHQHLMMGRFPAQNAKRRLSDDVDDAGQNQRPAKRATSGPQRACLICYLAHKTCKNPCTKCGTGKGSNPECVSSSLREKNIFFDSLSEDNKRLARDIISRRELNGIPAARALEEKFQRTVDLQVITEVLLERKVLDPSTLLSAHFPAPEDASLRSHPVFAPFYQTNIALQARNHLLQEPRVCCSTDDLLVLRAICAQRVFDFVEKSLEKNKKPKNMAKGSRSARNMIVFLGMMLVQTLSFAETVDGVLGPALIAQRNALVYHLAYVLRFLSKSTFPNGSLFTDVHIGPDNDVRLGEGFWSHLRQLFEAEDAATQKAVPQLVISRPTLPRENSNGVRPRHNSDPVTSCGTSPARRIAGQRRSCSVDDNAVRDNADAWRLLETIQSTDENTVDALIDQLETARLSDQSQHDHYTEFAVGSMTEHGWDMGVPVGVSLPVEGNVPVEVDVPADMDVLDYTNLGYPSFMTEAAPAVYGGYGVDARVMAQPERAVPPTRRLTRRLTSGKDKVLKFIRRHS